MNIDLQNWDKAAADWDKEIAHQNTYRTHLITTALEKLLTNVAGKKILDAGCGNGYFSSWLTERGAQVFGVDGSSEMIEIAKMKYADIPFKVHDLTLNFPEPDQSYDFVFANMLLMHMDSISIFLSDAKRLLKPNGELIFSVLHPCFNQPTSNLYKTLWQKITFAKPSSLAFDYYSHHPGRYESHFKTKLSHYHRTLEEYSNVTSNSGFTIMQIIEPHELPTEFLEKHPKFEYATRLPRFIFFKCKPI